MRYVIGYGVTGKGICNYLDKSGKEYIICDDFLCQFPNLADIQFKPNDIAYISPGISPDSLPNSIKNATIATDLDIFISHKKPGNIIAITGTNNKTGLCNNIAKNLINNNYNAHYIGNVGNGFLDNIDKNYDIYILEISSYQLYYSIPNNIDVCCITNFYPLQHVKWHGSEKSYLDSKCNLLVNNSNNIICSRDQESTSRIIDRFKSQYQRIEEFSSKCILNHGFSNINNEIYCDGKFIGKSEAANEHIIRSCLRAIDINIDTIKHYPIEHRLEHFTTKNNVRFINDSKATNFAAWIHGVQLSNHPILISGGSKIENINTSFDMVLNMKKRDKKFSGKLKEIKKILCIGECAGELYDFFISIGINSAKHGKMHNAILDAYHSSIKLQAHEVILLPCCQSYDMYKNFQARGDEFKRIVMGL